MYDFQRAKLLQTFYHSCVSSIGKEGRKAERMGHLLAASATYGLHDNTA